MKEPENNAIQLFEDQKIRVAWDAEREECIWRSTFGIIARS